MLALTRKQGESIVIGGNVRVTVVWVHGDKVRLGIDAPKDISVNREEIQRDIDEHGKREICR